MTIGGDGKHLSVGLVMNTLITIMLMRASEAMTLSGVDKAGHCDGDDGVCN